MKNVQVLKSQRGLYIETRVVLFKDTGRNEKSVIVLDTVSKRALTKLILRDVTK